MLIRFVVLLSLTFCHLEDTEALPGLGWLTNLVIDNADTAGIPLPGYVGLLSNKSSFLTKVLHLVSGNYFENLFKRIIQKATQEMPDETIIEDVKDDHEEKFSFINGKITGLKSFQMTELPNTKVEIISSGTGFPVGIVSVNFKNLKINADVKTKFLSIKSVDGKADMTILQNNFVLKFQLTYPGIREWCYLKLIDVICSDLEDMVWKVTNKDGSNDAVAASLLQGYFTSTDGTVEEHVKTTIANIIYHEVPKASPAICDNTNKHLKLSKYQTSKRTHEQPEEIKAMLKEEAANGAPNQLPKSKSRKE